MGSCLRRLIGTAVIVLSVLAILPVAALATSPRLEFQIGMADSAEPSDEARVQFQAINSGTAPLAGVLNFTMSVSPDATVSPPLPFQFYVSATNGTLISEQQCSSTSTTASCTLTLNEPLAPGVSIAFSEPEILTLDPGTDEDIDVTFEMAGAGAAAVTETRTIEVGPTPPYGVREWQSRLFDRDGATVRLGGATPEHFWVDLRPTVASLPVLGGLFGKVFAPTEQLKDGVSHLPPGLIGNPQAFPDCTFAELALLRQGTTIPNCPLDSQVGVYKGTFAGSGVEVPIYNVEPAVGYPARLGFNYLGVPIQLLANLRRDDYGLDIESLKTNTTLVITGARFDMWGAPAESTNDGFRGDCLGTNGTNNGSSGNLCPTNALRRSFLRTPTQCTGAPLEVGFSGSTYQHPDVINHATSAMPSVVGCDQIPFDPSIAVQPTSQSAETPAGLLVRLNVPNPGFGNPKGLTDSDIKTVKVSLPEGVTINPSQGEGLGVCTPGQYASEELSFHPAPGTGCPGTSKIGSVSAKTPLLEETLEGSVFIAKPFDNPFDSLVALYIVIKNPERGIIIKLAGEVKPDERTGQLVTTFDGLPQVPVDSFDLKFREGVRSPLATPRACGTYTTEAEFTPWANPDETLISKSSFEITSGVGGGRCPSGSAPFEPELSAGSINNNALSFSPFNLRMIREDGEQEITRFSADLPPGLAAKLAGVSKCSEADLRATAASSGFSAIEGSICSSKSQVGRVTAGYGVGSVQTRATGKVFLAGPYQGAPVSIATVIPAVVGPFDLGTVVQRSAFTVDPETAEVHVDSRASDPIPHILEGFELHLRDIRVYMDRPGFTFNPTSCDRSRVGAFLDGSGTNFFSSADDPRVDVTNPFQVANCSLLPFKPKLSFKLKGGTKRGDFPALQSTLKARPGDANLSKVVVALPKSQFLEQGHIGTVCTRVQFAQNNCPAKSIYGSAAATTPLLDERLKGPVYLRSSNNQLPDLVIALRGEIAVNAVARIDSVNGGIRSTFDTIPDTPLDTFTLRMKGGKKGLLVNSRNLCLKPARADVRLTGQNGKVLKAKPKMGVKCGKARNGKRSKP
jgi:hypothetical protein